MPSAMETLKSILSKGAAHELFKQIDDLTNSCEQLVFAMKAQLAAESDLVSRLEKENNLNKLLALVAGAGAHIQLAIMLIVKASSKEHIERLSNAALGVHTLLEEELKKIQEEESKKPD